MAKSNGKEKIGFSTPIANPPIVKNTYTDTFCQKCKDDCMIKFFLHVHICQYPVCSCLIKYT